MWPRISTTFRTYIQSLYTRNHLVSIFCRPIVDASRTTWRSIQKQLLYPCVYLSNYLFRCLELLRNLGTAMSFSVSLACRSGANSRAIRRDLVAGVHAHSSTHFLSTGPRPLAVASTPTQSIGNLEAFSNNLLVAVSSSPFQVAHWCSPVSTIFTWDSPSCWGPDGPIAVPDPGSQHSRSALREGAPRIARTGV